ncbi:MAG: NAD-dependent epimerase/dehydratase family protein, partial [Candidatus Lokiarchaeota archaeon]|nr:NAD-dependent epimerase/dehydratase family protein [Candidatus Lokiarchaeota archaeon]
MTKVLITGATGQVGSHLAYYIAKNQELEISSPEDIICLIRNPTPHRTLFLNKVGVTIVEGDLSNKEVMEEILSDADVKHVFHAAANCNPGASYREIYKPNVLGTRNLLEAFSDSEAKSFIFCSSIAVYKTFMSVDSVIIVDEDSPIGSLEQGEPYAISKRKSEIMIKKYAKQHRNKSYIITRLGVLIGPRDRLVLPSFVTFLGLSFVPKLISQGRDYISVTSPLDVCRAQVFLAKKGQEISGEIYNVAGQPVTYRRIFECMSEYFNMVPPQLSIPMWAFNMFKPFLDLIRKLLPNNEFVQKVLSPSSLGFIGKSYIYKTDKIESLGFEFMVSAKDTIIAGLKEYCPNGRIKEPYIVTEWKEQILGFFNVLEQGMADLQKQMESDAKKRQHKAIKRQAQRRARRNPEKALLTAEEELEKASQLEEKANKIVEEAKKETTMVIQNAKNKLKKAELLQRRAKATKKAAKKRLES